MAENQSSPSATHNSSPPSAVVPLTMVPPTSTSPKSLVVPGSPFVVPGAEKIREPPAMASSSDEDSDDPDVVIEGSTEPPSPTPPPNKRKSRTSLRLIGKSTAKKQKKEEQEISAKERLDGFRKRKFAKGMAMDIPWLVDNGGKCLVELMKKQGWVGLFGEKFHNHIHPNELAEFYCHLSVSESEHCTSLVKGEGLEFNAEQLGRILGVPAAGYAIHSKRGIPSLDYADVGDLVTYYSRGDVTTAVSFHQDALTPFHKLVYNLVRRSIVPRTQKRANVEVLDVVYMDLLISGKQINFPQLMIRHMGYMQKQFSLPYAPLITTILNHFSVPLKSVGLAINPADVMGEVAFKNLGIEVKAGKLCFVQAAEQEVQLEETAEEQSQKQAKAGTDTHVTLSALRKEMLAGFEVIFEKIETLDRRSGAVVMQVDRLTREITNLRDSTTTSTVSLSTSIAQNHDAVMKKLDEFEGTTVEQEVEEEEEDLVQEQPATSTPAP